MKKLTEFERGVIKSSFREPIRGMYGRVFYVKRAIYDHDMQKLGESYRCQVIGTSDNLNAYTIRLFIAKDTCIRTDVSASRLHSYLLKENGGSHILALFPKIDNIVLLAKTTNRYEII